MRMFRLGAFFVSLLLIPSTSFAFVVEFDRVRGNNNWVETNATPVDNDGAISSVDVRDLVLGDPSVSPDLFEYGECHGHYHFEGYASYRLARGDGSVVGTGRKQSFCLGDNLHLSGPHYDPQYHCNYQGITAGWGDEYIASLDCQWIDVTNVAPGSYFLEVTVNPTRDLFESSFTNNTARVPVTLR